jgi:hypothetical protein
MTRKLLRRGKKKSRMVAVTGTATCACPLIHVNTGE